MKKHHVVWLTVTLAAGAASIAGAQTPAAASLGPGQNCTLVTQANADASAGTPNINHDGTPLAGQPPVDISLGFKGRTAICELLNLSDRIREMILDRRPTSEIKKTAHEEGMRFLRESAVEKVLTGLTTLREINKVTFVE